MTRILTATLTAIIATLLLIIAAELAQPRATPSPQPVVSSAVQDVASHPVVRSVPALPPTTGGAVSLDLAGADRPVPPDLAGAQLPVGDLLTQSGGGHPEGCRRFDEGHPSAVVAAGLVPVEGIALAVERRVLGEVDEVPDRRVRASAAEQDAQDDGEGWCDLADPVHGSSLSAERGDDLVLGSEAVGPHLEAALGVAAARAMELDALHRANGAGADEAGVRAVGAGMGHLVLLGGGASDMRTIYSSVDTVNPLLSSIGTALIGGRATWYASDGMTAAAGPLLREYLGPRWRGTLVSVRSSATGQVIVVRLTDFCGCQHGRRLIDLSDDAFSRLAPLSVGIIGVQIERAGRVPPPPPTDTAP